MRIMQSRAVLSVAISAIVGSLCSCFNPPAGPDQPSSPKAKYGYIHNADGSPCANAKVTLAPSNYVPATRDAGRRGPVIEVTTDTNGCYSLDTMAPGTYNVFGTGDATGEAMVSFCPAVSVEDPRTPQCISRDTLSAAGGINGVAYLYPPSDNRKMLILVLGSNLIRWPEDAEGNFRITGLAKGTYRIRFLPTDPAYPVLDTAFTVQEGKVTDVGTINIGYGGKPKPLKENQDAYIAMKFGLSVHFNMSTFTRYNEKSVSQEWGVPGSDPKLFNPGNLNCGQWADAAKAAGCKYMILTVKHHDGFCLWDSKFTTHDVGSASWGGGHRDIVKEFVDSARTRGLKVGFYYSVWDKTNGHNLNFIKGQLTELLTNYGEITCLWFDGWKWMVGYTQVPHDTIRTLMSRLQPNCLLIENNYYSNMTNTDIVEFEIPVNGEPKVGSIDPQEACESIRADGLWFWHPFGLKDLLSVEKIKGKISTFNARNANYLLSVSPDTSGLIPQSMVDSLKAVGGQKNGDSVTLFYDGFEGDLSKWADGMMMSAYDPVWPPMKITFEAAHGGTHSVTGDSNRTALYFRESEPIVSGIVGLRFFIMGKSGGHINFLVRMGKDAGSSGGLSQEFGIGFDTSDAVISIFKDPEDPLGFTMKNEKHLQIETNYWYKCVIEANLATDTVSYYIDDIKVRSVHFPLQQSLGIDAVLIIRGPNGKDGENGIDGAFPYYADDIQLYRRK